MAVRPRITPTHKLANALLGQPLETWVEDRRSEGMSWREISFELYAATDRQVMVSFETLRGWFPALKRRSNGAAA